MSASGPSLSEQESEATSLVKKKGLFRIHSLEIEGTREVELAHFASGKGSRAPPGSPLLHYNEVPAQQAKR